MATLALFAAWCVRVTPVSVVVSSTDPAWHEILSVIAKVLFRHQTGIQTSTAKLSWGVNPHCGLGRILTRTLKNLQFWCAMEKMRSLTFKSTLHSVVDRQTTFWIQNIYQSRPTPFCCGPLFRHLETQTLIVFCKSWRRKSGGLRVAFEVTFLCSLHSWSVKTLSAKSLAYILNGNFVME